MSLFTPIHQYLLDISDREPLTDEQLDVLLQHLDQVRRGELPQEVGSHITHQLIEGSLQMVVHIAKHHYATVHAASGGAYSVSLDDLIQVGNLALVECVQRCLTQEHTHPHFRAYAVTCIRYAIIDTNRCSLSLSVSRKGWQKAVEQGTASLCTATSLDAPLREGEGKHPLSDRIAAPVEVPVPSSIYESKCERVAQLLVTLTEREQHILRLRYGLDEEDQRAHSYQEIMDKVGCSKQHCWRLERRIVQALRDGNPLRRSSEYYSATEAMQALGMSVPGFYKWRTRGIIQPYYPSGCDHMGVYRKTEIDALAQEYQPLNPHNYYTVEEAAACLSLSSETTLYKWAKEGKVTRYQMPGRDNYGGLFLKEDIDRLVRQQEEAATRYYTAEETAARLEISTSTVHRWARQGHLTRHRHPGLSQGGYVKEEVDHIVADLAAVRRDYYTAEQAAGQMGLSSRGFERWAQRIGITPKRRTLDGVTDLYASSEIDACVQEEHRLKQHTYTLEEASAILGVGRGVIREWVKAGKITCLHRPGQENHGTRFYPKAEVDTIARFLKKRQAPVTNITPLYEEVYAYAQ